MFSEIVRCYLHVTDSHVAEGTECVISNRFGVLICHQEASALGKNCLPADCTLIAETHSSADLQARI